MAFIVKGKAHSWEIRESHGTPRGPRSSTLATFAELTSEVIARARARAVTPLNAAALEGAARRAGAPVAEPAADRAARQLLAAAARGEQPRPGLARLVAELAGEFASNATSSKTSPMIGRSGESVSRAKLPTAGLPASGLPAAGLPAAGPSVAGPSPTGPPHGGVSDAARAAGAWAAATPAERGVALCDLLLLADALPAPRAGRTDRFPRIDSRAGEPA